MSDFLNDYNRQKTLGDAAGPPSSLGAWTAKAEMDAQQRLQQQSSSPGGGGIDVSVRKATALSAAGVALMAGGAYALFHWQGGAAIFGAVGLVIGAALTLFCGFGVLIAGASALGWHRVTCALVAGCAAGWLLPSWLLTIGVALPGWLVGVATALLTLFLLRTRKR